jgi:hypothetical protein
MIFIRALRDCVNDRVTFLKHGVGGEFECTRRRETKELAVVVGAAERAGTHHLIYIRALNGLKKPANIGGYRNSETPLPAFLQESVEATATTKEYNDIICMLSWSRYV